MERQLPYEISYNTVAYWRKVENGFLWSVFICSILLQTFQIDCLKHSLGSTECVINLLKPLYLQPIITQYFIDNKSEIWLLFLIAHSKR